MGKLKLTNEIQVFLKKYSSTLTAKECSEQCGCSEANIRYYCKKLGLQLKNGVKKSYLDLSCFLNPTPESAYILGWIWSDGYIQEHRNTITIEIVNSDAEELIPIIQSIGVWSIRTRYRENRQPQTTIQCTSKDVANYLRSLGKFPKSTESHANILATIPAKLRKYFILGLLDGDGCFYLNESRNLVQFSISGSKNQDWTGLLKYFNSLNISSSIHIQENPVCCSLLRITNRKGILTLINELYTDTQLGLSRKKGKAKKIKNYIIYGNKSIKGSRKSD